MLLGDKDAIYEEVVIERMDDDLVLGRVVY